jgi:hypothetical protein
MAGSVKRVTDSDAIDADMIAPPVKATQRVTKLSAREFDGEDVDLGQMPLEQLPAAGALKAGDIESLDDDIDSAVLAETKTKPQVKTAAAAPPVPTAPPKTAAPKDLGAVFSTEASTPAELDEALIDKYGDEWLKWEPETLWQTIRLDFGGQIARINKEKINAAKLLHLSDSYFRFWDTFEKVVCAFNNVMPLFDRVQDFTLGQAAHAMRQAAEIRKESYHNEVLTYLATKAKAEGLIWLPPPLDVVQEVLDKVNPPEIVPLKNEIQERWNAFEEQDLKNVELKEDIFGINLARLAAIDEYLRDMSGKKGIPIP